LLPFVERAAEGDHHFGNLLLRQFLVPYIVGESPRQIIEPVAVNAERVGELLDHAIRRHRHDLLNPRQDFDIVVPPQFASWGAPPPPWYIDALMRHIGEPYYVRLLKAANCTVRRIRRSWSSRSSPASASPKSVRAAI
jgi:hypothetical protein